MSLLRSFLRSDHQTDAHIQKLMTSYGSLIYDLCFQVLWDAYHAKIAFQSIFRIYSRKLFSGPRYSRYEKAWILKIVCEQLIPLMVQQQEMNLKNNQMKWDIQGSLQTRLKQFSVYLHRLKPEDQLLLLLKEKYQVEDADIALALKLPLGSLKVKRQQALFYLDEWLWKKKS